MTDLKRKTITNLLVILLVILLATVFSASASIPVVKVEDAKGSVGSTIPVNVTLSEAPNGLSGYNITVSPENPNGAEIISVGYPEWASLHDNGSLPSDSVWIKATDLNENVQNGSLNIILATLSVRINANERMVFGTTINLMDDDNGNKINFNPATDRTIKVESSSSGDSTGVGGSSGENYSNIKVIENPVKEETQTVTPGQTETMSSSTPVATMGKPTEPEFTMNWALIIGVLIVIGVVVMFRVSRKSR